MSCVVTLACWRNMASISLTSGNKAKDSFSNTERMVLDDCLMDEFVRLEEPDHTASILGSERAGAG
eukprot:3745336-Amphidinium_carterae.1